MPSILATPAQIEITGAAAQTVPARFTGLHATLNLSGAIAVVGPGTGTTLAALDLAQLGRLDRAILAKGFNSVEFQLRWQRVVEAIEEAVNALNTQVNDNTALLGRIAAAQDLASAANTSANQANDTISITNSYVGPVNLLTASNDGIITIAAHTRYYGNGTSVSVSAGSVTGFSPGDYVTVYYKDAAREGGTVAYVGTTSAVAQKGDTHVVGQALIPASGSPLATGSSTSGAGYREPTGTPTYDPDYIEP